MKTVPWFSSHSGCYRAASPFISAETTATTSRRYIADLGATAPEYAQPCFNLCHEPNSHYLQRRLWRRGHTRRLAPRTVSVALIRNAKRRAWEAISDLKRIDRRLTALGCLEAHVHFKRRLNRHGETVITNMMYLLQPQDRSTGRRGYTYIGISRTRQDEVLARIERFKVRKRLRARITQLKQTYRVAERELATALAIYRALRAQARECAREFAPYASPCASARAAICSKGQTGATMLESP